MNKRKVFFSRCVCFSVFYALIIIFSGCQFTYASGNDSHIPGVLEYALKYGSEKQKEKSDAEKSSSQQRRKSQTLATESIISESQLRRRSRQQEIMLEQVRRENQRLRQEKQKAIISKDQQQKNNELQSHIDDLQNELKTTQKALTSSKAEQLKLKSALDAMPVMTPAELERDVVRQDYAAGVVMGQDLMGMQEGQSLLGLKTDNRTLLAGLRDALNHQVQINDEVLQKAVNANELKVKQARESVIKKQKAASEKYLAGFRKIKGAKKDKSGFWYRVDYMGDGKPIAGEETRVEVVVTEALTDGKVVEDMDAVGRSLVMKLDDYPQLFRDALIKIKNHGTMTLVVPPELAYGDEGYPPKIPPGATMVYTLRVENVTFQVDTQKDDISSSRSRSD